MKDERTNKEGNKSRKATRFFFLSFFLLLLSPLLLPFLALVGFEQRISDRSGAGKMESATLVEILKSLGSEEPQQVQNGEEPGPFLPPPPPPPPPPAPTAPSLSMDGG